MSEGQFQAVLARYQTAFRVLVARETGESDKQIVRDLAGLVSTTEESSEFAALVDCAARLAAKRPPNVRNWLSRFLKNYGFYSSSALADPEQLSLEILERLKGEKRVSATYLVSLPWIGSCQCLDTGFADFKVVRLESSELANLMSNHIRRTFFPGTALSQTDIELRSCEGFLVVRDSKDALPPGCIQLDFSSLGRALPFTEFSERVERSLAALLLLDWSPEDASVRGNWFPGYPIGAVIELSEDYSAYPAKVRGGTFRFAMTDDGVPQQLLPGFVCNEALDNAVEIYGQIMRVSLHRESRFFTDLALRFFLKSALIDPWASPFRKSDQFVNAITALDSLAGDSNRGASARLARRMQALTGCSEKRFLKMYNARSRLVHGDKAEPFTSSDLSLSWEVFDVCKRALRRALQILDERIRDGARPDKQQFLQMLDEM